MDKELLKKLEKSNSPKTPPQTSVMLLAGRNIIQKKELKNNIFVYDFLGGLVRHEDKLLQ